MTRPPSAGTRYLTAGNRDQPEYSSVDGQSAAPLQPTKDANMLINPFYLTYLRITKHIPAPEGMYQKRLSTPSAIFFAEQYEGLIGTISMPTAPAPIRDQCEAALDECKESTQTPKSAKQKKNQ